jgi:hypothetical protein
MVRKRWESFKSVLPSSPLQSCSTFTIELFLHIRLYLGRGFFSIQSCDSFYSGLLRPFLKLSQAIQSNQPLRIFHGRLLNLITLPTTLFHPHLGALFSLNLLRITGPHITLVVLFSSSCLSLSVSGSAIR